VRQARLIAGGRRDLAWVWLRHSLGVVLVLVWICGVCRIGLFTYLLGVVYPATALIMVRSLAERRAAEDVQDRTAVVENAGLLGLLFLNNNLHLLHHARPSLPWYVLPAQWRATRANLLMGRGGPVYRSYLEVAALYALRPHHPGPHPDRLEPRGRSSLGLGKASPCPRKRWGRHGSNRADHPRQTALAR
jgi:fatty acid desaturase